MIFAAVPDSGPALARRAFGGVQPRLSPDGQWIAVSYQGAIGRLPSTGGPLTRLSTGEGFDLGPAWSPDGKSIAFINSPNFYTGRLQWIRADNGAALNLPKPVTAQGEIYFHPDGRRLLGRFSADRRPARIAWYNLETGDVEPVKGDWQDAPPLQVWRVPLALSQDGRRIAYATHQDIAGEQGGNDGPQADLWAVPAEGGAPEKIVQFPTRIYGLCWDASGAGIYIVTDLGTSHNDIWHVPLQDPLKNRRKLTYGQADEDWPSIDREGRLLIHTENQTGATALVRVDSTTHERRTLTVDRIDFGQPTASLRLKILDRATGRPTAAKVFLKRIGDKFHAPLDALYRVTSGRLHFYARDESEMTVPAGDYELVTLRGPEYRLYRAQFELKSGESALQEIALERWTDQALNGWFSGENHIHANYGYGAWYNTPASVLDQCEGEDLNVCNVMVANSDGDGVFDREFFGGRPDAKSQPRTILYWNQEFRSTIWGHMTLVDLTRLVEPIFTGFKDTTNPWDVPTNADIAEQTHHQHGFVSYTHPANNVEDPYHSAYSAKGVPVDAALGKIDAMDVMGGGYEASVKLWYRLLNCGFRIPAAAGTDCFLNRIASMPPGWGRAYVHLTNGLSYKNWIAGMRAGHSFVSNGPILELTVDDTGPGGVIRSAAPRRVRIHAKASSQHPLERLELVRNGSVVLTGKLAADRLSATLDEELPLEQSGWIALRADGPAPPYHLAPRLSAHTSPIFVEVQGRPFNAKGDAEYFLAWIDRLEKALRERGRIPVGLEHVESQLAGARAVYREILQATKQAR